MKTVHMNSDKLLQLWLAAATESRKQLPGGVTPGRGGGFGGCSVVTSLLQLCECCYVTATLRVVVIGMRLSYTESRHMYNVHDMYIHTLCKYAWVRRTCSWLYCNYIDNFNMVGMENRQVILHVPVAAVSAAGNTESALIQIVPSKK